MSTTTLLYSIFSASAPYYEQLVTDDRTHPGQPAEPVFVGQAPSFVSPAMTGWIVDSILQKNSVQKVVPWSAKGCLVVWVANQEDQRTLIAHSHRIGLNSLGIWDLEKAHPPEQLVDRSPLKTLVFEKPKRAPKPSK